MQFLLRVFLFMTVFASEYCYILALLHLNDVELQWQLEGNRVYHRAYNEVFVILPCNHPYTQTDGHLRHAFCVASYADAL